MEQAEADSGPEEGLPTALGNYEGANSITPEGKARSGPAERNCTLERVSEREREREREREGERIKIVCVCVCLCVCVCVCFYDIESVCVHELSIQDTASCTEIVGAMHVHTVHL